MSHTVASGRGWRLIVASCSDSTADTADIARTLGVW